MARERLPASVDTAQLRDCPKRCHSRIWQSRRVPYVRSRRSRGFHASDVRPAAETTARFPQHRARRSTVENGLYRRTGSHRRHALAQPAAQPDSETAPDPETHRQARLAPLNGHPTRFLAGCTIRDADCQLLGGTVASLELSHRGKGCPFRLNLHFNAMHKKDSLLGASASRRAKSYALPAEIAGLAVLPDIAATLHDIASTPEADVVPPCMPFAPARLSERLDGALTLLTGR